MMMAGGIGVTVLVLLLAFGVSLLATRRVLVWLRRQAVLDVPNDRSSHSVPTPRGGGLAVTSVIVVGWGGILWIFPSDALFGPSVRVALAAGVGLAIVSWVDDRMTVSWPVRLCCHALAVGVTLMALPMGVRIFGMLPESLGGIAQDMPLWLDRGLAALMWVWFVNLFNFMDGIDGITGVETAGIGAGVILLATMGGIAFLPVGPMGAVLVGTALGFLVFNWQPARVFLGDVGSVPVGFLVGYILIILAVSGFLVSAVILPAYYVFDATVTLGWRVIRGKSMAVAHREHFYQRAVHRAGLSHAQVSARIALANGGLCVAAVAAGEGMPVWGLGGVVLVLVLVLASFQKRKLSCGGS